MIDRWQDCIAGKSKRLSKVLEMKLARSLDIKGHDTKINYIFICLKTISNSLKYHL